MMTINVTNTFILVQSVKRQKYKYLKSQFFHTISKQNVYLSPATF